MTAEDFKNWRQRMRLSQQGAATILGIALRTVTYYEAGRRIPASIERLCRMLEAEHERQGHG